MDNYLGEIRIFPYNRIPSSDGWKACSGQTLQIRENVALFSLLGINYGGDGKVTFMLPNLNGRTIIGCGIKEGQQPHTYAIGSTGGFETIPLKGDSMPTHNHPIYVKNSYDAMLPGTNFIGNPNIQTSSSQAPKNAYNSLFYTGISSGQATWLNPLSISSEGGGIGHENRMPFIALVYCIATKGVFPPREE